LLSRPLLDKPVSTATPIVSINDNTNCESFAAIGQQMTDGELCKIHTDKKWAHPGRKAMKFIVESICEKKGCNHSISEIVKHCDKCQRYKSNLRPHKEPLQDFYPKGNVGSNLNMDIMGKYQYKGKGFYALIVVDKLSRYLWLKYTAKTFRSRDVVNFLDKIIGSNDLKVDLIITYQGPQFFNSMWKSQCIQRGIPAKLCSTHYPKTDGLSERSIQTLKMKMRLSKSEEDIQSTLATIVLCINEVPHSATEVSPVKVMAAFKTREAAPTDIRR
jgi:hypothetical protein